MIFPAISAKLCIMLDHNDLRVYTYLADRIYVINAFYVILNIANRHKKVLSVSQRSFLLFLILTNGQN